MIYIHALYNCVQLALSATLMLDNSLNIAGWALGIALVNFIIPRFFKKL